MVDKKKEDAVSESCPDCAIRSCPECGTHADFVTGAVATCGNGHEWKHGYTPESKTDKFVKKYAGTRRRPEDVRRNLSRLSTPGG